VEHSVNEDILHRLLKIRLLVLDCDGVLTDGRIIPLSETEETKFFEVKDGHGIRMAGRVGLRTAIISGRKSFAVRTRAKDLGIAHLHEAAFVKIGPYEDVLAKEGLTDEAVCYVGDDVTDIPLLRRAGLGVVVADGVQDAKDYAHLVTQHEGGRGAVREVVEMILRAQGKWADVMARYID